MFFAFVFVCLVVVSALVASLWSLLAGRRAREQRSAATPEDAQTEFARTMHASHADEVAGCWLRLLRLLLPLLPLAFSGGGRPCPAAGHSAAQRMASERKGGEAGRAATLDATRITRRHTHAHECACNIVVIAPADSLTLTSLSLAMPLPQSVPSVGCRLAARCVSPSPSPRLAPSPVLSFSSPPATTSLAVPPAGGSAPLPRSRSPSPPPQPSTPPPLTPPPRVRMATVSNLFKAGCVGMLVLQNSALW